VEDQGVVFWVWHLCVSIITTITIVVFVVLCRVDGCGVDGCGRCPVRDCPEGFRRVGEGACWDLVSFWLLVFGGWLNVFVIGGGVFCVVVCKGGEGEGSRDGDGDGECSARCEGWEEG